MESSGILIVDDEPHSRMLIRKLLSNAGITEKVFDSGTVTEAFEIILHSKPGIFFLDVQMKNETGFDLLNLVKDIDFEIIFTTAHSEFAVRAFRYSAADYLMKPIDTDEFLNALEKVKTRVRQQHSGQSQRMEPLKQNLISPAKLPEKLTIPTTDGFLLVSIPDILYCHAINNYTSFYLQGNEKLVSSHNLGYYDELLAPHGFFRPHRSYLVNPVHIKMYRKGDGGTLVMKDGQEIEVSRGNKELFLKLFKG